MSSLRGFEFSGTQRFQVLSRLGEGGMGVVYQALDRERSTRIALKTLSIPNADAVLRFKNEFRALADLEHPNLVSLGELICEGGQWFFTMELVEGVDFLSWVRPNHHDSDVSEELPANTPRISAAPRAVSSPRLRPSSPESAAVALAAATQAAESYNTPDRGRLDESRLREALSQLALGLTALHAAGKVHRDIKPSNILITAEGRLVLLDFGLATDVTTGEALSEVHAVGTVDYMAPEQAAAQPAGPEADWYSVGVALYEALTGRLPFTGAALEILMNKQRFEPAPPRALSPRVAPDLDALCVELLHFAPEKRPLGHEVLARLGVRDPNAPKGPQRRDSAVTRAAPFVGRKSEMATLAEAFQETRRGAPISVLVEGESGLGKSMLVRRFTEGLPALSQEVVVVLAGRCYEREAVPYKALDGVIDALSRYMARLAKTEAAALLPLKAALLAQVFPVLRRVEAVAHAPLTQNEVVDPQELRTRVFAALRELFGRLADRHPLVLVIDDLQWADADSLALLAEVLRPPYAPAILLLATVRTAPGQPSEALELAARISGDVRRLRLSSLGHDESCELVNLLWRDGESLAPISPTAIAEETRGHPLFIDELVRHLVEREDKAPGSLRLEDALWSRIRRLDPEVRELLEVICVAGAPLGQEVAGRAAGVDSHDFARRIGILRVARLARTSGVRGANAVEAYHDRVREAVVGRLTDHERRDVHRRLAGALEAVKTSDPEALSVHWFGAEDAAKAAHYAALAGDQASEALAFDRAARLYRVALGLIPGGEEALPQGVGVEGQQRAEEVRRLKSKLGDALANSGEGAEAARIYLEAASGANAADALEMQRRAAEQYLRSGHLDEGLTVLREVLAAVGMKIRTTPRGALMSLLLQRARLRLRGRGYQARDQSQISARDLTKIDILWSASVGVGMVDHVRGADYQTRHMLLALQAGEPYRIARALTIEAAYSASPGDLASIPRTMKLLAEADALAAKIGHPHADGMAATARNIPAYVDGKWRLALGHAERALEIFRERCTNVSWERNTAQMFAIWSLFHLGEIREMSQRVRSGVRDALESGDIYLWANMCAGLTNIAWLVSDEPDVARRHANDAMRQWSKQGFHLQHYYELLAHAQIDLYAGTPRKSYMRMTERWSTMRSSLVLRVRFIRTEAENLRGRLALASALEPDGDRDELLRQAHKDAQRGIGAGTLFEQARGHLLEAGVLAARGKLEDAAARCEIAAQGFDATAMTMHASAARCRRGELIGGAEGRTLTSAYDVWATGQGIVRPERILALLAPGFAR